ncbi:MAG: hypothetical protein EBS06_00625 [Proteobacteria bacterium]|nr:hypothetical protein [Pseudomonadota bacterium]
MLKAQFLLLSISIIPLFNCLLIKLFQSSEKLINIISKLLPILFFLHLIGLLNGLNKGQVYIELIKSAPSISFGFMLDSITLKFLFLLNFIWIIFVFYSHRFLRLQDAKNLSEFKLFFAIAIALINLVFISQNLLTSLLFYNCLALLCHFLAVKFLYKKEDKFSYIFTSLLYLESLFFFFTIVATYKFSGRIEFSTNGILPKNLEQIKAAILLILYLGGLFCAVILPSYLLYRKVSFDLLIVYVLFFLSYALSSLYILLKILVLVFSLSSFSQIILKIGLGYFDFILLLNLLISGAFLLLSKNFKSAFFYLLFNQLFFALFAIFTFAAFNQGKVYLVLLSFLLSITLVFFCFSNLTLYLSKAENKSLAGLFYDFKITMTLLAFALLNLIGIVPTISALEKFFLAKIILQKKIFLTAAIFVSNALILALFSCRLFYILLSKSEVTRSEHDLKLAKDIDFDSSLTLTALITAIMLVLALILKNFFPYE